MGNEIYLATEEKLNMIIRMLGSTIESLDKINSSNDELIELLSCDDCDCESPEDMAKKFHETYERLAPEFGYATKKDSAVHWDYVPKENKNLMIAVCKELYCDCED